MKRAPKVTIQEDFRTLHGMSDALVRRISGTGIRYMELKGKSVSNLIFLMVGETPPSKGRGGVVS